MNIKIIKYFTIFNSQANPGKHTFPSFSAGVAGSGEMQKTTFRSMCEKNIKNTKNRENYLAVSNNMLTHTHTQPRA